jgi:3'(2'), 5'-bisphosphate nucleotidase
LGKIISNNDYFQLSELAVKAAKLASIEILNYYSKISIDIKYKEDNSPVTIADVSSDTKIRSILKETNIPIVSEEKKELKNNFKTYWLVDPLDGTKDFLASSDEFAINIALINNKKPVIGVILAPALNELYVGIKDNGVVIKKNQKNLMYKKQIKSNVICMAESRFHKTPESEQFAKNNNINKKTVIGASLKYARLIESVIDVYPRYVGTSEWDTAAGQVLIEATGGAIIDLKSNAPLLYGKRKRRNGSFIAFRDPYKLADFII